MAGVSCPWAFRWVGNMDVDPKHEGGEYPELRRLYFLRLKLLAFASDMNQLSGGYDVDGIISSHLYLLFHKIYEGHLESKYMNKAQASSLIPLKHAASCSKYLDIARSAGYIIFERKKDDTRNYLVKPTARLIKVMEENVDSFTSAVYGSIKSLAEEIEAQKKRARDIENYLLSRLKVEAFTLKPQDASKIKILAPIKVKPRSKRAGTKEPRRGAA